MTVYEGRRGLKQLQKIAHKGMKLHVVYEGHGRFPGAPGKYYSTYVLDHRGFMSGEWMSGTASIQLLLTHGPIHDTPPPGIQNLDGPLPQVEGPLGLSDDEIRQLSRSELHDLAKQNRLNREERKRLVGI